MTGSPRRSTGPVDLPEDGDKGFLGVGPQARSTSTCRSVGRPTRRRSSATIVVGSVQGMGQLFSPSGIGNLFHQVATASDKPASRRRASTARRYRLERSETPSPASVGASSSENATARCRSSASSTSAPRSATSAAGPASSALLAMVNIFLGLINLVPLLPLDGGHIAVACYEEIRTRIAHRPYRVDMAKLMPVTYVVLLLIAGARPVDDLPRHRQAHQHQVAPRPAVGWTRERARPPDPLPAPGRPGRSRSATSPSAAARRSRSSR